MTGIRAGDWVEVRSKEEILKTLDKRGLLGGMPFMPEMFEFCGRRMRVESSAHKTCDTVNWTGGRRVEDAVHLEDSRCGGKGHGGCEAGCLIFWKTAWLKPVADPGAAPAPRPQNGDGHAASWPVRGGCTEADVKAATEVPNSRDADGPTYVCQATTLPEFTTPLPWWDARQYVDDYKSGNAGVGRLAVGFAYALYSGVVRIASRRQPAVAAVLVAAYDRLAALRGGVPFPRKTGTVPAGQKTPHEKLDLRPGELVRIKPYEEILATLNEDNKNRGLYFDAEHVPFCNGTYRVRSLIGKIVNEKTGKMMEFKSPSIVLDGVTCQSRYSNRRMFCPRAIYPYWREIWLQRAGADQAAAESNR